VVEALTALDQTTPTNPNKFAFFKGFNEVAINGVLNATVPTGLLAGSYRMCSINTAANHQPALGPIAQHGSFDDCSYFTVNPNNTIAAATNGTVSVGTGATNGTSTGTGSSIGTGTGSTGTTGAGAGKGGKTKTVTVKRGDSCAKIAKANGISLATLLSKNPKINKRCTNLEVGEKLVV